MRTQDITQYAVKSILRGVQDTIVAQRASGMDWGQIAAEHHYTEKKTQDIYKGTYTSKQIKTNSDNSWDGFGIVGKVIAGSIGFAVAGPIGLAVAGGVTCLADTSIAKDNATKKVNAVVAVAKKEEADKNMFVSVAKKSTAAYNELSVKFNEQIEYVSMLEEENEELRAEIERLHAQINNIYS